MGLVFASSYSFLGNNPSFNHDCPLHCLLSRVGSLLGSCRIVTIPYLLGWETEVTVIRTMSMGVQVPRAFCGLPSFVEEERFITITMDSTKRKRGNHSRNPNRHASHATSMDENDPLSHTVDIVRSSFSTADLQQESSRASRRGRVFLGTSQRPRFLNGNDPVLYPSSKQNVDSRAPRTPRELLSIFNYNHTALGERERFLFCYRNRTLVPSSSCGDHRVLLIVVNCFDRRFLSHPNIQKSILPAFAAKFNSDFDIVFFSQSFLPSGRVLSHRHSHDGILSYHVLRLATSLFPATGGYNYTGVLVVNDKSFVDPSFLNELDWRRSWGEPSEPYTRGTRTLWNTRRLEKKTFSETFMEAMDELSGNTEIEEKCRFYSIPGMRVGRGYFYYIDEKDVALALKMEEVFYRHGVFYEFAVPTMMYCLNKHPVSDCIGMRSRGNESCLHAFPVDYSSESEVLWTLQRLECCVCLRAVSHQNDHLFLPPAAILFSVSFFLPFHSNSLSPPSSDGVPNSVCGAPSRFPHQGVHFKDHHYCVFKVRNGPSLHLTLLTILSPPPRQNNTMISALLLIDAKGKNIVSRYYRYCTSPPSLTR